MNHYQLRLLIFRKKYVYDDIIVTKDSLCRYEKENRNKEHNLSQTMICLVKNHAEKFSPILLNKKGLAADLVSAYIFTMNHSSTFRQSAVNVLKKFIELQINLLNPVILIRLRTVKFPFLDYKWNERLIYMVLERQEIDHAMSWLSTLGGAFSALGDQFGRCAQVAGKISVEQFKLAIRLGDPQLVARCNLYAALSLLQQGHLKASKLMVQKIFNFSKINKDIRLQKMCQGVWAKLKYCYSQRKNNKLQNKLGKK